MIYDMVVVVHDKTEVVLLRPGKGMIDSHIFSWHGK